MRLKAIVENLDDVPEALREYYVEKDGKFWLDAEGVEDVSGLKSALGKERTARQAAENKLREFREAGIEDPKKVSADLEKLKELQQFDPTKEAEKIAEEKSKARERQLIEAHNRALESANSKTAKTVSQLKKVMVDAVATKAIVDQKGSVELLLPIIQGQARLKEDNGNYLVEILDQGGNPRIGDAQGTLMTIDQLVTEMKGSPVYGRAFDGSGASGTGAPPGGEQRRGAGSPKVLSRTQLAEGAASLEDLAAGKVTVAAE